MLAYQLKSQANMIPIAFYLACLIFKSTSN